MKHFVTYSGQDSENKGGQTCGKVKKINAHRIFVGKHIHLED
jgi:hypothetical protein